MADYIDGARHIGHYSGRFDGRGASARPRAARRYWEARLRLPNAPSSDWAVLVAGGGNPPGNVRVHEAAEALDTSTASHSGFARDEVLDRAEGFIEYARAQGASIAGASGAGGDAPKFLLREDEAGRWHADGALGDERTKQSWIVKFPRSSRAADRLVLELGDVR